jgi:hypothetical protein
MTVDLPDHLLRMVRRPVPAAQVVPASTRVVAFGDPRQATVATLGINPSWREFLEADGSLLTGAKRRLATLTSLGAEDTVLLKTAEVRRVIDDCVAYFRADRNPYRRWFNPLDEVLRKALGVSYYNSTACHLDLVQWATAPAWRELANPVRRALLDESLPHLRSQLNFAKVGTVLLNGRQVIEHVVSAGLVRLQQCGALPINARLSCSLYHGEWSAIKFIGWSSNLQSSRGIDLVFRTRLARWLAATVESRATIQGAQYMFAHEHRSEAAGHVTKGVNLASKPELVQVLQDWLNASDEATIGRVDNYGGKAWISIRLDKERTAVLNADTKRVAVEEYVKDARTRGADVPWAILPNRKGRWNKLAFRADGEPTPGWYCYLRPTAFGRGRV